MLAYCTLYRGLFALIAVLIVLEYLFGSIIETKNSDNFYAYNTTRTMVAIKERLPRGHKRLFKILSTLNSSSTLDKPSISHNKTSTTTNVMTNGSVSHQSATITLANSSNVDSLFELTTEKLSFNFTAHLKLNNGSNFCTDSPPDLIGRIPIVTSPVPTVLELERRFSWLKPGGHGEPDTCLALCKIAIIVPFRCRAEHLLLFLQHMHPYLRKQLLDYTIYVVEQAGDGVFNRAMLMNIGFVEASKIREYDCFIFHDVDLLPEDDRNMYLCPEQPRHMSAAVDQFLYKIPYPTIFGGVSAITKKHFELLNGFSNAFWGWGGEDDDMSNRIRYHNLYVSRYPLTIARYTMLNHKKEKANPTRMEILKAGKTKYKTEGLSNLKYRLKHLNKNLLYTWILAAIEPPSNS